jgi:hypothetical protein
MSGSITRGIKVLLIVLINLNVGLSHLNLSKKDLRQYILVLFILFVFVFCLIDIIDLCILSR